MRVLVTGGAGFIGSHVVDALLARGNSVIVLDDLSSGKLDNLKQHLANPKFTFVRGDIRDVELVERTLEGTDAIIHEAATKSVPLSFKNPAFTHDVNVNGTLNLLRAASKMKTKRFAYASSAAVYGEQKIIPMKEDAVSNPLSPYGYSKLLGEKECLKFWEAGEIEVVCLRYFNVYGPRLTGGEYAGVMVKFAERLRNNQPPIIYGDGEQTRDFVHVRDVVNATLQTLEHEKAVGNVINVGSGEATSINELCEIFLEATNKTNLKPIYQPPRQGDIKRSQADIAKARELLGYKPTITLEKGVRNLLNSLGVT